MIVRQQWVGFTDPDGNKVNPQTYLFSIDSPMLRYYGVGLTIVQDQLGFEKNLDVKLSGSRRWNIGNGKLGIGIPG